MTLEPESQQPSTPPGNEVGEILNGANTAHISQASESASTATKAKNSGGMRPNRSDVREVVSFLKTLAIFLAAALVLRASVVEAFKIPSGSMLPTLQIGDHILVSKFSYGLRIPFMKKMALEYDTPRHGDIVVFTRPDDPSTPEDESDINIIKRVIGIPGDVVEVKGTRLFINNQLAQESYARWEEGGIREGNFDPERVPEGHVFMLGDNRDHSRDSRFWPNPFLDIKRIKGRALLIYWSWEDLSRIAKLIQ